VYIHHSARATELRSYKPDERQRRISLTLNIPVGQYTAEWIRPADAKLLAWEKVTQRGSKLALEPSPEYTADIALRIVRSQ
jgi:hypothetical protein